MLHRREGWARGWHAMGLVGLLTLGCATGDGRDTGGIWDSMGDPTDPGANTGTPVTTGGSAGPIDDGGTADGGAESSGDGATDPTAATDPTTGPGDGSSSGDPPVQAECGNSIVEEGEECDGTALSGASCADFGFDAGDVVCGSDCTVLTDACFTCGDGQVDMTETCDGAALGGQTCVTQGFGSGSLACAADCQALDTSACVPLPSCGDGIVNGPEQCDGAALGGNTCQTQGFDMGVLGCTASCLLDVSQCQDDLTGCGEQGDFCLFDKKDLQSTCCPAGVGGNVLGICDIFLCV